MSFDEKINELLRTTCERLPEGFRITITMVKGEATISLEDAEGSDVELCTDDLNFEDHLDALVDLAIEVSEVA